MLKKSLSILLAVIMLIGIFNISPLSFFAEEAEIGKVAAEPDITEESSNTEIAESGVDEELAGTGYYDYSTFNERLNACQVDYPNGSYSNWQEPSLWYECWAYANRVSNRIFGSYGYTWNHHQDRNYIYPGDVIRMLNYGYYHSIVVTAVDGDTIYFTDRNGTSNYNMVRWGASINRWNIAFAGSNEDKGRQGIYHAPNWDSVIPWVDPVSYANMDVNFYVEGKDVTNINNIGKIQVYVDGQLQKSGGASSYTDFCQDVVIGKYYEVKVTIYDTPSKYRFAGVDTSESGYSGISGTTGSEGTKVRIVIVKDDAVPYFTYPKEGDYLLISALNNNYVLDIAGDSIPCSNGDNVALWKKGSVTRYQDTFNISANDDGYYTIKQKGTNMALDVNGASPNRYANIQMWENNGSNAQRWKMSPGDSYMTLKDGTKIPSYTLQSKCSGMYLTVDAANAANGTNILQGLKSSIPKAQEWYIVPVITKPAFFSMENSSQMHTDMELSFMMEYTVAEEFTVHIKKDNSSVIDQSVTSQEFYYYGDIMHQRYYYNFTEPGTYTAYVTAHAYGQSIDSDKITFEVKLGPQPGNIDGTVVSKLDNQEEILINLYKRKYTYVSPEGPQEVYSDTPTYSKTIKGNNAKFLFESVEPWKYQITVTKKDHFDYIDYITVDGDSSLYITLIPNKVILGDADGDGEVTMVDVTIIQRACANMNTGIDTAVLMNADVDGSGALEIIDATWIQRHLAKMGTPYVIEKE